MGEKRLDKTNLTTTPAAALLAILHQRYNRYNTTGLRSLLVRYLVSETVLV